MTEGLNGLVLKPPKPAEVRRAERPPFQYHGGLWIQITVLQPSDFGTVLIEFLSHTSSRTYGKTGGQVLWTRNTRVRELFYDPPPADSYPLQPSVAQSEHNL
jgi:hypothetical protein